MVKLENIDALGTHWWFEFYDIKDSLQLESFIKKELKRFEEKYSRFLDTSLVSELNKKRKLPNCDKEFEDVLKMGIKLYTMTSGYFNFLNGRILEIRGYDKTYSFRASKKHIHPSTIDDITINKKEIQLFHSAQVDIGGFGKGYLIDLLARKLHEQFYLRYFLINGGGDIFITSNYGKPVEILLENPQKDGEYFSKIKLKNKSLCCSSPFKRQWKDKQVTYSHIINTLSPQSIVKTSAFVVHEKACIADAFATAFCAASEKKTLARDAEKNDASVLFIEEGKLFKSQTFPSL
jgi:thiamine biosynthesis lipoprotein